MFFFIEERGKLFWLKCKRPLAVVKKENLKRHYETNHPELKKLDGELRKMKIKEFKKNLYAQQSVMTFFCSTNDNVLTVSYEVSELIAKKLKPYDDGAWAKELLVKAAEKLAPKSVHLYQKLSLSRPTVCERIKEMGQDIEDNLKKRAEKFVNFSLLLLPMKQQISRIPCSWQYFFEGLHQIFKLMRTCCLWNRCTKLLAERTCFKSSFKP